MTGTSGGRRSRTTDALGEPRRVVVGALVPAMNQFGLALTAAIQDVGYGSISSNADLVVLGTVWIDGPQRPSRLTELTGLTSGGTTNLLDRLEGAELIHRTSEGVDDGRGVMVETTDRGERAILAISAVVATQTAASPEWFDEMADRFRELGHDIERLPSSLTDPTMQVRDVLRLAEAGRLVGAVLDSAIHDPTPSRSTVALWFASQPGGVRPGRLAELTGLSSAGVSELLDRLEQRMLIVRTAGRPPDRRVVIVETTPVGRDLLASAIDALDARFDEVASLFGRC